MWVEGFAYTWAWYRHDAADLVPVIRDLAHLERALASSVGEPDLPGRVHDYPDVEGRATPAEVEEDRALVAWLREQLGEAPVSSDDSTAWLYLRVLMNLTPHADVDALMPYLDATDPFVQELAVVTLGDHRHPPARAKLEAIAASGRGNAKLVAPAVLGRW